MGTARSDAPGRSRPSGWLGVTTAAGAPAPAPSPGGVPPQHASHTFAPGGSSRPVVKSAIEDGCGAPPAPLLRAHAASANHFTVAAGGTNSCTSVYRPGI